MRYVAVTRHAGPSGTDGERHGAGEDGLQAALEDRHADADALFAQVASAVEQHQTLLQPLGGVAGRRRAPAAGRPAAAGRAVVGDAQLEPAGEPDGG